MGEENNTRKMGMDINFPNFEPRMPNISHIPIIKDTKMADTFYERLKSNIEGFEKKLKSNEQLMLYCSDQAGDIIHVTDIGYHNPYLILFYGFDSEKKECSIMVHMNSVQLNTKIINTEEKKRKIGFHSSEEK